MEELMKLLQTMGFSGNVQGLADTSTGTIDSKLSQYYGVPGKHLPAHMFSPISKSDLSATQAQSYAPQIQAGSESLLSSLSQTIGGKKGTKAFGGFAGSGQQQKFMGQAKDVYGKGMSDVLTEVGGQRSSAVQSLRDMIDEWRRTATSIRYGG